MKLIDELGMGKEPVLTEEQRAAVVARAADFFRIGGAVTMSEARTLSEQERDILREAAQLVFTERMSVALEALSTQKESPVPEGLDAGAQKQLEDIMDTLETRR